MACQETPTLTLFSTALSTSFVEHTIATTQRFFVDVPVRKRQDPPNEPNTTTTLTTSISEGTFSINDWSTTVWTYTSTETLVETNLIPTQTQFASCSETGLSTSTTSSSTSAPTSTHSGTVNATIVNPAQNRVAEESLETTTSDGITVVVSQYATTVDGTRTVTVTPIQTLLHTSERPLSASQRTGVIAGTVGGALFVLLVALALIFCILRRRKSRARNAMMREQSRRPARHLLEAEADDYRNESFIPPMSQWDALSLTTGTGSIVSAPKLLRARGSKTGSLFHENVWPPPTEAIQDPLLTHQDLGSSISLAMGIPIDVSTSQDAPQPGSHSRPTSAQFPMAVSTNEVVGAVGRQQCSSAHDSVRSMDYTNFDVYDRSHSRAESTLPLLDSAAPAARTISPPLTHQNAPTPPPSFMRPNRTNMRVSYTASDMSQSGSSPSHPRPAMMDSGYSATSISPLNTRSQNISSDGGLPSSAGSGDSELLRDVMLAGSRGETSMSSNVQEIPPLYHTLRRDIP